MKKKILFIIWSYTYGGGAEALLTTIANNLNRDKYDVSIIEYRHADIKVEPVNDYVHVLPPIEAVPTPENYSKTYQLYNTPEVLINTYIKKDFDLYVSFNYQIPSFLLPKGTKNIAWIHSDVYDLADEKVLRERVRQDIAFDNVKKIVAISDNTEKSIEDLFPRHIDKVVKIYNGIDIKHVREMATGCTPIKLESPSILIIGRLEERKDPLRAIDIIKTVRAKYPDVHLYYLGDGDLAGEINQQAEEKGVGNYIHLLGYQTNPYPIIKQADVVCMTSKSEGFSMALLEAVALGIPFVSTKVGGAVELSNGQKCGRVFDTDDGAVSAICELLQADKEKIKPECSRSIERFSLKNYISQIEDLFDEVLNEDS
jgi:glycosyltransferase involved in cell wall biosynthesis